MIVSEAAIDYIQPVKQTSQNGAHRAKSSTASVRKVDRMIDVSTKTGSILYEGGSKVNILTMMIFTIDDDDIDDDDVVVVVKVIKSVKI